MPKKTKTQKLKAITRRTRSVITQDIVPTLPAEREVTTPHKVKIAAPKAITAYERTFIEYTKKDLVKTLIIALVLFSLEFGIFYATLKGVTIVRY